VISFGLTEEQELIRDTLREFAADALRPIGRECDEAGKIPQEFLDTVWELGLTNTQIPTEYGGAGEERSAVTNAIVLEELGYGDLALAIAATAPNAFANAILDHGTDAQKQYFLPRILDGTDFWCQGYSEPGAGSDLASLKCAAVRDGDHYVVNGQKTWTTLGHYANRIFCLVRTSSEGKPQTGISFLLIDMESEGVDVRPLITLDGRHEVNEIFLTDVRVPVDNLVGEENRGWDCAKYLLTYERTNSANVGASYAALGRLKALAANRIKNGKPLAEDQLFAARMARVEIELANMSTTNLRVIASVAGGGAPGAESSILKILGTEVLQEITNLARIAMGPEARILHDEKAPGADALTDAERAALTYFNYRKLTIFAGSNEIQKNIIAKRMLAL